MERTEPIYNDKPRITKKVYGKVVTKKRGIFTQAMKKGLKKNYWDIFQLYPFS